MEVILLLVTDKFVKERVWRSFRSLNVYLKKENV